MLSARRREHAVRAARAGDRPLRTGFGKWLRRVAVRDGEDGPLPRAEPDPAGLPRPRHPRRQLRLHDERPGGRVDRGNDFRDGGGKLRIRRVVEDHAHGRAALSIGRYASETDASIRCRRGSSSTKSGTPGTAIDPASAFFSTTTPENGAVTSRPGEQRPRGVGRAPRLGEPPATCAAFCSALSCSFTATVRRIATSSYSCGVTTFSSRSFRYRSCVFSARSFDRLGLRDGPLDLLRRRLPPPPPPLPRRRAAPGPPGRRWSPGPRPPRPATLPKRGPPSAAPSPGGRRPRPSSARTVPIASTEVSRGTGCTVTTSTPGHHGAGRRRRPCFSFPPQADSRTTIERTATARAPHPVIPADPLIVPDFLFRPGQEGAPETYNSSARECRRSFSALTASARTWLSADWASSTSIIRPSWFSYRDRIIRTPSSAEAAAARAISTRRCASRMPRYARATSNDARSLCPRWYSCAFRRSKAALDTLRLPLQAVEEVPPQPHARSSSSGCRM